MSSSAPGCAGCGESAAAGSGELVWLAASSVAGPKARDLLAEIAEADLSLPWLSVQYTAKVAGKDVALVRVSFAGELGWEIHCDRGDAAAIYDAVLAGGAKPFGMRALNAMRVEKGYRSWKATAWR